MSQSAVRRILAVVTVLAVACLHSFTAPVLASAAAPYVYIDAGHGGPYSNANENGLYEKNITLLTGLELRNRLAAEGYQAGIDRTTDTALCTRDIPTWHWAADGAHLYADGAVPRDVPTDDLQTRDNLANAAGADVFVSIHCNGVADSRANGAETFAPTFDPLGRRLSTLVQQAVIAEVGATDRGAKETNFYVIRWANMPAVLIELGFLSDPAEAAKLASPIYRWRLARGIAHGVADFFAENPFKPVYPRLAGTDRYGTAAAISRAGWPKSANTVLLATGQDWPDAVAAAPLSRKLDAPLLLVTRDGTLPPATAAELARLHPAGIVVLGSEAAVSTTVTAEATAAAKIGSATVTARRIGGVDRYETAALIAAEVGLPADGRIAIASGTDYADAISVAPYAGRWGMPLLLGRGATLPSATRAFVTRCGGALRGVVSIGAGIPRSAVATLPGLVRIAGADRWATNALMARAWGGGTCRPLVANGAAFPDALVAAALGAKQGQPLLLVAPRVLPDRAREYVGLAAPRLSGFTICGSSAEIPYLMDAELQKAMD